MCFCSCRKGSSTQTICRCRLWRCRIFSVAALVSTQRSGLHFSSFWTGLTNASSKLMSSPGRRMLLMPSTHIPWSFYLDWQICSGIYLGIQLQPFSMHTTHMCPHPSLLYRPACLHDHRPDSKQRLQLLRQVYIRVCTVVLTHVSKLAASLNQVQI